MSDDLSCLLDATLTGYEFDGWGELMLTFGNGCVLHVDNDDGAGFHIRIDAEGSDVGP